MIKTGKPHIRLRPGPQGGYGGVSVYLPPKKRPSYGIAFAYDASIDEALYAVKEAWPGWAGMGMLRDAAGRNR